MPPFALTSSNSRRMALALLTPWIAVTPDRSVTVPMRISVSVTPWVGPAANANAAADMDNAVAAAQSSVFNFDIGLASQITLADVRPLLGGPPTTIDWAGERGAVNAA